MTTIAAAAGVSVPTIEQVFRTKANLLKTAIDVAIAGDDEPVPILRRPLATTAAAAPTIETFLAVISVGVADVAERAAGLVLVAFEAAVGDPRLQPLAEELRDNRAAMAKWIVDGLVARTPLRPGIDRSHAVDVVWLLMDPAVFTRLRIDRGWSRQRFQQWFADSAARLLTDLPGVVIEQGDTQHGQNPIASRSNSTVARPGSGSALRMSTRLRALGWP
jgi:AcrR family transcriptional regulator